MTGWVKKLFHLPGTKLTPEVVLHRTLNKLEYIHAVTIIVQWKNGEYATDWSQMKISELCMASKHLDEQCRVTMFKGEN